MRFVTCRLPDGVEDPAILSPDGTQVWPLSWLGLSYETLSDAIPFLTPQVRFGLQLAISGIPGTPNLAANKTVTDTCVSFAQAGKKVAAICAAPSVLAQLGLLEGRKATAHAGFQDQLAGAEVLDAEVVVDGSITTSYGLGGAIPFALELVRQLAGQAEADRIRNAIAYRH